LAIEHSAIPNAGLHEPKGVSSAASGQVYVADGLGSGAWDFLDQAVSVITINEEADFPVQDASTITLESGKGYYIANPFTTAKQFVCDQASLFSYGSAGVAQITYTGTSPMFSITNSRVAISQIAVDCPNSAFFSLTGSGTGDIQERINCESVEVFNCTSIGTATGCGAVVMSIMGFDNVTGTSGLTFSGSSSVIWSLDKVVIAGLGATATAIDLGAATTNELEFIDIIFLGNAAATAISGAASSANITTGGLAVVADCNFSSLTTPLNTITNQDIRWSFRGNAGLGDTYPDGLLSLHSNATATTISLVNTPVLVAGTWNIESVSQFTGTAAGRLTYNGERDIHVPIDVSTSLDPSAGTNKDLSIYVALNGTPITNSSMKVRADSGNPQAVSTHWQLVMSTNDYIEVYVENNTDTTNIVVIDAILRLL
jgi:hypothetical protein